MTRHGSDAATPVSDAPTKERRTYVTLSKRGKKMALTLNGGVMFKDAALAFDLAVAAMKRDGWKKAVLQEMELDELRVEADGSRNRYWRCIGTCTITPPKGGYQND